MWQCSKAARRGYRACGKHGAGFKKREREGKRKSPVLAHTPVPGPEARPETIAAALKADPELMATYREYLLHDMLDFRSQLALAKTLLAHYLKQANLDIVQTTARGGAAVDPPLLRAIEQTQRIMKMGRDLAAIEKTLGPLTHADVERLARVFTDCLAKFVPCERWEESHMYMEEELRSTILRDGMQWAGVKEELARSG